MSGEGSVVLRVVGAGKRFPPATVALADVDFELHKGEVHALLGENGAGKSTLSRIIAGLQPPDSGEMFLKEQSFTPTRRADAEGAGVRMVMQELNLIPTMTVAESIFIDRLPNRLGWINRTQLNESAVGILDQVGLGSLDPDSLINSLGIGKQQLVEIAAGLSATCQILILDEPTAALTETEVDLLFGQIEKLKSEGVAIVYISHRMEEISRIADRITVLRDGRVTGVLPAANIDLNEVIQLMVGRKLEATTLRKPTEARQTALRVENLCAGSLVRNISFKLNRGEILGFAGLMGSGRTETMRAIFGTDPKQSGKIYVGDSNSPTRINSPKDAVAAGMAFVTEDRKHEGLLLSWSIQQNISLTRLRSVSQKIGWIRQGAEKKQADQQISTLGIRCSSSEQPVQELSGGNQQKVVIAKWLHGDCDILIFDEPTRGIDIGAKFEIYELLNRLANQGKAILLVSSELPELLMLSHRIAVMSNGHVAQIFGESEFDQNSIMQAALSGYLKNESAEISKHNQVFTS